MAHPFIWQFPLLFAVGLVAGVLNVLAGGGSLLTLPILLFMGLPAATANGTNRLALCCQNIAAITGFHRGGVLTPRLAALCTPTALVGAWLGARVAIGMDDLAFKRMLALVMIGVLVLTTANPFRRLRADPRELTWLRKGIVVLSFFGVGVYGGLVQAGVGFLIIAALLVHGFDLVRINAVKVVVIFCYTIVALGVFIGHGEVDYSLGLALAVGNTLGGWLGPRVAIAKGHAWINRVVSVTVLLFALKLLLWP